MATADVDAVSLANIAEPMRTLSVRVEAPRESERAEVRTVGQLQVVHLCGRGEELPVKCEVVGNNFTLADAIEKAVERL